MLKPPERIVCLGEKPQTSLKWSWKMLSSTEDKYCITVHWYQDLITQLPMAKDNVVSLYVADVTTFRANYKYFLYSILILRSWNSAANERKTTNWILICICTFKMNLRKIVLVLSILPFDFISSILIQIIEPHWKIRYFCPYKLPSWIFWQFIQHIIQYMFRLWGIIFLHSFNPPRIVMRVWNYKHLCQIKNSLYNKLLISGER